MSGDERPAGALAPGLYLVATPIGNARDITLRALDVLAAADVLAAEDTRTARKLMEIHGIPLAGRRIVAYHDHNGPRARPGLLAALREGRSVAYVPEAGTPLVADPGFALARDAIAEGLPVTAVPGPSALLAALTVSGLPSDRVLFAGFLPPQASARRAALQELRDVPATLVVFEAPGRCSSTVREMVLTLGKDRKAAVCRELTKRFEEVRRGTLAELAQDLEERPVRGEVAIVVERGETAVSGQDMVAALDRALETMSVKEAATAVSQALGVPRREVYRAALERKDGR